MASPSKPNGKRRTRRGSGAEERERALTRSSCIGRARWYSTAQTVPYYSSSAVMSGTVQYCSGGVVPRACTSLQHIHLSLAAGSRVSPPPPKSQHPIRATNLLLGANHSPFATCLAPPSPPQQLNPTASLHKLHLSLILLKQACINPRSRAGLEWLDESSRVSPHQNSPNHHSLPQPSQSSSSIIK